MAMCDLCGRRYSCVLMLLLFLNGPKNHSEALPTMSLLHKEKTSPYPSGEIIEHDELSIMEHISTATSRPSESSTTHSISKRSTTPTTTDTPTSAATTTTVPATQDSNHNLIIIFDTNTTNIDTTTTTTTTLKDCTRNCCSLGRIAGRKGYLCIALPNFSRVFNTLLHPYKVKRTHPKVIGRGIERCAMHPARKRIYEQCCEEAQHLLWERNERIKECEQSLGRGNCNHLHYRTPECY